MFVFLFLFILSIILQTDAAPKRILDEEIYDKMLTLGRTQRLIEDKLDWNFVEEKKTGELIKNMLTILDKHTQKLDLATATIAKFDDRLANIEAFFLSNAEKDQTQKTQTTVTDVKDFSSIMEKIKNDIMHEIKINKIGVAQQQSICKGDADNAQKIYSKIDNLTSSIQSIQEELSKDQHRDSQKSNKQTNEYLERIELHLKNNEEILEQYDIKHDCSKIINQVSGINKNDTEKVLIEIKTISNKLKAIPEKTDLDTFKDQTVMSLNNLRTTIDKYFSGSIVLFQEKADIILKEMDEIKKSIPNSEASGTNLNSNRNILSDEIRVANRLIQKVHEDVLKLENRLVDSQKFNKVTNETMERIQVHLSDSQSLLDKYETSLKTYDNKIKIRTLNDEIEISCHRNSTQALEEQNDAMDGNRRIRWRVERVFPKNEEMIESQSNKINFTINENFASLGIAG